MNPIFLKPIFKDYLWGGTKLKEVFEKQVENEECTAESWEVSTNENGSSIIKNEEYEGMTLKELFEEKKGKEKIFGTKCTNMEKFPILIKYLDANDKLSVQVHPDDEYAIKFENGIGKTEMWYILDCDPEAKIICGVKKDITKEDFKKLINKNHIIDGLEYINVEKGDSIFIEAGTVHALLGGTLVAEVQQNSDITYRLYDWDRIGPDGNKRDTHVDKALEVIDFNKKPKIIKTLNSKEKSINILNCKYFNTDKIKIEREYQEKSNTTTFYAMNVVEGEGVLNWENKQYHLRKGDSFLIPASLGEYKIIGKLELLKSYIS